MREPVILLGDGHTYEKSAIEHWFATGRRTSPMIGRTLTTTNYKQNYALRKAIDEWLTKFPEMGQKKLDYRSLEKAIELREEDLKELARKEVALRTRIPGSGPTAARNMGMVQHDDAKDATENSSSMIGGIGTPQMTVQEWLKSIKCEGYEGLFVSEELDNMEAVMELTKEDMQELGVRMGARKLMLKSLKALKAKSARLAVKKLPPPKEPPTGYMQSHSGQNIQQKDQRNQRFIVVGGAMGKTSSLGSASWTYLSTAEYYCRSSNSWIPLPPMPNPRVAFGAAVSNNKLIVAGGHINDDALPENRLASALEYDFRQKTWNMLPCLNERRSGCRAVVLGNKFIVLGGWNRRILNSVEAYDSITRKWIQLPPMKSTRQYPAVGVFKSTFLLVAGGWGPNGKVVDTVEMFSLITNEWHKLPSMRTPRNGAGYCTWKGKFVIIGGKDNTDSFLNTVEMFDLETRTWSELPPMNEKRAWCAAGVIDNGDSIVVVGGYRGGRSLASAELYRDGQWERLPSMSTDRMDCAATSVYM